MIEKYKKICKYLNYVENLFILSSRVAGCVSISGFALCFCVPVGIPAIGMSI